MTLRGDDPVEDKLADALVAALFADSPPNSASVPIGDLVRLMQQDSVFVTAGDESLASVASTRGCKVELLAELSGYGRVKLSAATINAPLPAGTLLTLPPPSIAATRWKKMVRMSPKGPGTPP